MKRSIFSLLVGSAFAIHPGAAAAQAETDDTPASAAASPLEIPEVVVTARKREESLQRVPVAVAVIDENTLRNNAASDLTKVGELAPQVSMSQGGSGTGAVITVRGVSSGSNDAGLDQSVAVEVDDVPISRGQVISSSVFDIAQVQVLQGPQALFFGKNSPAGVISLRSADPTDSFEAYVTPGYEFEAKQRFVEGAISGPLADTFKARVAFRATKMDGWLDNVAEPVQDFINPAITDPGNSQGKTAPQEEVYAGRLTLLWTPTEDFDAKLKLLVNSQERNGGNATTEPFCVGDTETPVLLGAIPIPGGDCKRNGRTSHGSLAPEYAVNFPLGNGGVPYFDSDFVLGALTLNKRWDALSLTSTTGYYDQTVKQASVSDWSPFATVFFAGEEEYELWTQELRIDSDFDGPLNFMLGFYYETFDRPFSNAPDLFHYYNAAADNYMWTNMVSKSDGDYVSAFAQLSWDITPTLELAGGARWSRDKKSSDIHNEDPISYLGLYPDGEVLSAKYDDDNLSPEVTLTWTPNNSQTLYGAYKTGYKAGGISNPYLVYATAEPQDLLFKPEEAKGGEVGYKATVFDRRLRFDLTAYTYKYDNLQVVSYNADTISFTIGNAASARIKGVQGSFDYLATERLTLRGNIGYNSAKYLDYANAPCFAGQTEETGCAGGVQDLGGKALLRAPKLTFSVGANYYASLPNAWAANLSVQASHTGSYEAASDYGPGGHQKDYWMLNAAVRVGPESERFELALIGRNLTDSYYMLNTVGWTASGNPDQYVGFFNRPREVVLQATVRF